jgi:hypothetical protein
MEGDNHWLLLRDPGAEVYAEAIERFLAAPSGNPIAERSGSQFSKRFRPTQP